MSDRLIDCPTPRKSIASDRVQSLAHLNRLNYYADFTVYPGATLVLLGLAIAFADGSSLPGWLLMCSGGVIAWTLIEYLAHRFVLHGVPAIASAHHLHHDSPGASIGTPLWVSGNAFAGVVFFPIWWCSGFQVASAVTAGLLLGYTWYIVVHHAVHHWRIAPASWLYGAKLRHLRHHLGEDAGNFGVTTGLWDRAFTTAMEHHRDDGQMSAR